VVPHGYSKCALSSVNSSHKRLGWAIRIAPEKFGPTDIALLEN
jgi:hypothetical protein